MLCAILFTVLTEMSAFCVGSMKRKRIEFVVPHHNLGGTAFYHALNDLQHLSDRTAAIDQIANEDRLAIRRPINAAVLLVAQLTQQRSQFVRVTVDITDNIDHWHHSFVTDPNGKAKNEKVLSSGE
jgi:hypothetical protein